MLSGKRLEESNNVKVSKNTARRHGEPPTGTEYPLTTSFFWRHSSMPSPLGCMDGFSAVRCK
jgi:hypothetical protein